MIKTIIFDMDGVLVDAKEIHYESLNKAIDYCIGKEHIITREEHLTIYDGLPTKKKLELLNINRNLNLDNFDLDCIFSKKQEFTFQAADELLTIDHEKCEMLKKLSENNKYKIFVASNSIRKTVRYMLSNTGMIKYIEKCYGNEDVKYNKPHPEIYLKIIADTSCKPSEVLIVEDSIHGREAAIASGANLMPVDSVKDVTYKNIEKFLDEKAIVEYTKKWDAPELNILIPMAGLGSRFSNAGYTFPKPLIEVNHKPMIQVVVENLNINANFIYVVQQEHYEKYNLKYLLNLITPNCKIVQINGLTEGAACTTLLAKEFIDNDKPLLIANSDQYLNWDSSKFYYSLMSDKPDGSIITFKATHPKWSFVKLDENNNVTEVAEKKPISDIATVGVYYWGKGSDYVKYAEQMIHKKVTVNSEFYVAPVYNEAIADGKKIKIFDIPSLEGLGTPEDLNEFLRKHN